MKAIFQMMNPARSGDQGSAAAATTADAAQSTAPRIDWEALRTAGRACCCPARPAVVAVLPPAADRDHRTELLLCMHHFRESRARLESIGAAVLDLNGHLVPDDAPAYISSQEEEPAPVPSPRGT